MLAKTYRDQHVGSRFVQLNWVAFDNGFLALGHRPGKKMRSQLEATGCSLVVNLLSHNESKSSIHDEAVANIRQLRELTADELTEERMVLGDRIAGLAS